MVMNILTARLIVNNNKIGIFFPRTEVKKANLMYTRHFWMARSFYFSHVSFGTLLEVIIIIMVESQCLSQVL